VARAAQYSSVVIRSSNENLMSDPPVRLPRPRKKWPPWLGTILTGLIVAALLGIGSSWKATFDECSKTEHDLHLAFGELCWEIYYREEKIAKDLGESKTIHDLKAKLKEPYYFNSKYKDESLLELRLQFTMNQDHLRIVEGDPARLKAETELEANIRRLPRFVELQDITYGNLPNNMKDTDLEDLSVIMFAIKYRDLFGLFMNPLRISYQEGCTLKNVTNYWLGSEKLVFHGTLTTFLQFEEERIKRAKEHPETK
jgi:hypothetical protein